MANISVLHDTVFEGAEVTATGIADGSGVAYLYDDRLSYKFVTTGKETEIQINLPVTSGSAGFRTYAYVVLSDHSMENGFITVEESPTQPRTTKNLTISGTITAADPFIVGTISGEERLGDQFLTVHLTGVGVDNLRIGELMIVPKFTSPQSPGIGIQTEYMPRTRYFDMANGERQSIKDAEIARKKTYTIGGMSITDATEWIDLYTNNEGKKLVILEDDTGDTYPCMMSTSLTVNDQAKTVSIELTFEEVKL